MFQLTLPTGRTIVPALIVVDMQNGFVSKGGSYDKIGMNTPNYREIIPKLKDLIEYCTKDKNISCLRRLDFRKVLVLIRTLTLIRSVKAITKLFSIKDSSYWE
jgi:hypothetical protein